MRRVAIEITRTSVRALLLEGAHAQPRVRAVLIEPCAADGPGAAEALRRIKEQLGAGAAMVRSALPREQAISRMLKLPATKPDELAQMAALAAKTQLPYPVEQAVTNFHVVDVQGGMSTVQLVAYHRELIEAHVSLLRQAGLEPMLATPSAWAIMAWYRRIGRTPEVREPAVVLHVDADRTDVVVIRGERALFSRSLDQGLREWQGDAEAVEWLAQEVERSVSGLRKELPGVDGASLVLTGLGELEPWKGLFEQRLGKPVIIRPAVGDLRLPSPGRPGLEGSSLAVVLGLALADESELLNVLPGEVRRRHVHRRRMRDVSLAGLLAGVAVALGAGLLWAQVSRQTRWQTQMAGEVRRVEAVTKQTERQQRNVRAVEQALASRRRTAAMLSELFRLTLPEIQFEQVLLNRAPGELTVRGSAPTTRAVLEYIRALEQAGLWQQVDLRYSARRGSRTDFEIMALTTLAKTR